MIWRVDVIPKDPEKDSVSQDAISRFEQAGFKVKSVCASRIFLIESDASQTEMLQLAEKVLVDHVVEDLKIQDASLGGSNSNNTIVVFKKPGVMDPVEESTKKAFKDLGLGVTGVRTGIKYSIKGKINEPVCKKLLANDAVDQVYFGEPFFTSLSVGSPYKFELITIHKSAVADYLRNLSLNEDEIKTVQQYFKRMPTDVELETIAQTWSEHCKHKTFNSTIKFKSETIENLFKKTIVYATKRVKKPFLVSVFKDNAGIIRFTKALDLAVKVETHNHPSAIEPYGGANTGLGGVIRDLLGAGLGAKPVAGIDVFAVANPDCKPIAGTIDPKILLNGVVAGVRDYGNRMGIPTVCGSVYYDNRYLANPLVYCGVVGVLPRGKSTKTVRSGDAIILIGGRTGRDGIHGATFSSSSLHEASQQVSSGAVQIGNAIVEKRLLDFVVDARDRGLFTAVTDCGAGGLSSAVGEITQERGAVVYLERVPLKYVGLSYKEIWISEAQERMVLIVPRVMSDELTALASRYGVEVTEIGDVTNNKRLVLFYQGVKVCDLDMNFLHDGIPDVTREAKPPVARSREPHIAEKTDYSDTLCKILSSNNVRSKEWIIRQYDHEVQGQSVIKPMCGKGHRGPSDGVVIRSPDGEDKGVAIGLGMNPGFSDINSYDMAALAIDEAVRNVVACGANPSKIVLLDNFCWGDVSNPEILGALVEACKACRDIAIAYKAPFISGKDSLNNTYRVRGKTSSIPHTLLITAVGIVDSIKHCVSMDAKCDGEIYIVGVTRNELGGSEFYKLFGELGANVPKVDSKLAPKIFVKLHQAIKMGIVRACHDVSEGGIAVALAEMCIAGLAGAEVNLSFCPYQGVLTDSQLLFSESATRFIVETNKPAQFERVFKGFPIQKIGRFTDNQILFARGLGGKARVRVKVEDLEKAFSSLHSETF